MAVYLGLQTTCKTRGRIRFSAAGEVSVTCQMDRLAENLFTRQEARRYVGKLRDIFIVKSSGSNTNIISGKLATVSGDPRSVVFSNFLMRCDYGRLATSAANVAGTASLSSAKRGYSSARCIEVECGRVGP